MDIVPGSERSCSEAQPAELSVSPSPCVVWPERWPHRGGLDIVVTVRQSLTYRAIIRPAGKVYKVGKAV